MNIHATLNAIAKDNPTLAMTRDPSESTDEGSSHDVSKRSHNQQHNTGNKATLNGTAGDNDSATGAEVHFNGKKKNSRRHHDPPAQVLSDGTRVTKYKKTKTLPDGVVVTKAVVKTVYPNSVTDDERSSPPNPYRLLQKVNTKTRKTSPDGLSHTTTTIEELITTDDNSLDPATAVQRAEHSCILPDGSELTTIKQSKRHADGRLSTSITRVHTVTVNKTEAKQSQTDVTPTLESPGVVLNEKTEVEAELNSSFCMMGSPEVLPDDDFPNFSDIADGVTFSSPATLENVYRDEEQNRNLGEIRSLGDDRNAKQKCKSSMSLPGTGVGAHFIIPYGNIEEGNVKKNATEFHECRYPEARETCCDQPRPMELFQRKILSIPRTDATYHQEFVDNNDHHNKESAMRSKSLECRQITVPEAMESYEEEPIPTEFVRGAEQENAKRIVRPPGRGVGDHAIGLLNVNSDRAPIREKNDNVRSHFRVATVIKRGLFYTSKNNASHLKNSSIDLKDQSMRDHSSIDIVEDTSPPRQGYSNDGLVVATKVESSEDNEAIYAAIEYDSVSKPPMYNNRRCRLYTSMSLLMITIIVALVVVYSTKKRKEEVAQQQVIYVTEVPTLPPTTDREALGLNNMIEEYVLQSNATFHGMAKDDPRWLALDWILHKDGMQLGKNDLNLYQRYVLVLLAFQFDSLAWSLCGGNYIDGDIAGNATCTIENENTTDATEEYVRWLTSTNECKWYGVTCLDGKVRGLELPENNLIGKIPPEISILRFIDILNLSGNCLIGTIPSEMGWMTNLQQLNLEYNGLSGYVPDEFFNMSSLTRLNLSWQGGNERNCTSSKGELIELQYNLRDDVNYGLEGEILKKIGSLRHLKEILVDGNYFSGEITPDIKNLKQLEILSAGSNVLSGTIPEEISELAHLREIWLELNSLSGSIPENIGLAKSLEAISLFLVENMTGTIPDSFYNLTKLKELYLYSNAFEGIIKSDIGNLKELTYFLISDNQFTGTLPSELGNCQKLEMVQIDGNQLGGTVPKEVCALTTKNLNSEIPDVIEFLKADCSNDNGTNLPFIHCDCCSVCCDHTTTQCINLKVL
ncbi:hypothetical protein ACHAW6_004102 [Cyclotella cf. meneghiniana]